nr:MAG TPA_asm: hypothetical protein [Bacteriophage sp.]
MGTSGTVNFKHLISLYLLSTRFVFISGYSTGTYGYLSIIGIRIIRI